MSSSALLLFPWSLKLTRSVIRPVPWNRRVEKWASYVHPGLHTLEIASTQRVESSNSALKWVITRPGSTVDVNRAILGKIQDDASKTER